MGLFEKIEKIENVMFTFGSISVSTTVTTASKNAKDGYRKNCVYNKDYNSQKYSDTNELSTCTISPSRYLVFSFKKYIDNKFVNEDVYLSFKHVELLKNYFDEVYNELVVNIDNVYTSNGVTSQYSNAQLDSAPMIQDKYFAIWPEKLETKDNVLYNGIIFNIVLPNNESFDQEMSLDNFLTLKDIIDNYDLLTASDNTLILGALNDLASNGMGSPHISTSSTTNTVSSNNRFSRANRKEPTINRRATTNVRGNRTIQTSNDNSEEENTSSSPRIVKKTRNNNPTEVEKINKNDLSNFIDDDDNDSTMSLSDIMKAAESIDTSELVEEDNDDIKF
jgi:hypothetical protein